MLALSSQTVRSRLLKGCLDSLAESQLQVFFRLALQRTVYNSFSVIPRHVEPSYLTEAIPSSCIIQLLIDKVEYSRESY